MSIPRNSFCPCGSGLKYKKCCLLKEKLFDPQAAIEELVSANGYPKSIADVISRLNSYIKENKWQGACHASCAALYVALVELGFSPTLCAGEVDAKDFIFDHSWIELDGKIIDIAVASTLNDYNISNVVVFGTDIFTKKQTSLVYNTPRGRGLDLDANMATGIPFCIYMDNFPDAPKGLWSVVENILGHNLDLSVMHEKYRGTKWRVGKGR